MALTRRRFLGSSAAVTAAAAAASTLQATFQQPATVSAACSSFGRAPLEVIALNRMAWGPRPGDIERVKAMGFEAYVEEQLAPAAIDDSDCDRRLNEARLRIRYDAGNGYPALTENRPLVSLNKSNAELWPLARYQNKLDYQERQRPYNEVRVATWIRALHSKRQLLEVMADFWHNHFNVKADSSSESAATFPVYDRIVREHAFGNFRTFVEEIGRSTAMMYYLDQVSNRVAGGEGGNENYSRELLELHTLGSDHYFKFYDKRSEVGTEEYKGEIFARGYIDEDVYQASYCFTGWTIRNGHWQLPDGPAYETGDFFFYEDWHQAGTKLVLTRFHPDIDIQDEFIEDKANPENEGKQVFDRVAYHIGTARHICKKLCRRLIADEPSRAIIDATVEEWMAHRESSDQIERVLRVILLSDDFKSTWGAKIKRPLEMIWSYLRAVEAEILPDGTLPPGEDSDVNHWGDIFYRVDLSGHRLFQWPTPTGHPDLMSYWANTNSTLHRWNLPYTLTRSWGGAVQIELLDMIDPSWSCITIVDTWIERMFGYQISATVRRELINFLAQENDPNQPPQPRKDSQGRVTAPDWDDEDYLRDRLQALMQLLVMSPDYQLR
jgi:uncharacterized protein (DUF1800 family)